MLLQPSFALRGQAKKNEQKTRYAIDNGYKIYSHFYFPPFCLLLLKRMRPAINAMKDKEIPTI